MWRRLTTSQFQNSLRALLGEVQVSQVEDDVRTGGFATTGAALVTTSSDGVEKYQLAVESALDQVFSDSAKRALLLRDPSCPPKVNVQDACTLAFVTRFGRQALRRALTPAERDRYVLIAESAAQTLNDASAGARWAASALLQSPKFLYRAELGQAAPGRTDVRQLTDNEMASRLSFLLWDAPPDEELLTAAETGSLTTAVGIRGQAQRLLDAPAGRRAVGAFVRDFFWLSRLDTVSKDPALFPNFKPNLVRSMSASFLQMWETTVFQDDGNVLDLFTTRRTFVDKQLAAFYGLPTAGLTDDTLSAVELPPESLRVGFLGSAALLSLYSDQKEASPTLRGRFIREEVLCKPIPPPPDDVKTMLEDPPAGVVFTKREKLDQHRSSAACAACHQFMDPLGFALENFDAAGQFRTTDAGKPVDASGSLDGQAFNSLPGLAATLKASPDVASCLVRHLYRYSTGAAEAQGESAAVDQLTAVFGKNDYRLRSLLLELVTSEGFRFQTLP